MSDILTTAPAAQKRVDAVERARAALARLDELVQEHARQMRAAL